MLTGMEFIMETEIRPERGICMQAPRPAEPSSSTPTMRPFRELVSTVASVDYVMLASNRAGVGGERGGEGLGEVRLPRLWHSQVWSVLDTAVNGSWRSGKAWIVCNLCGVTEARQLFT